jgi:UDP-glucose 4-epimerase
LPHLDAMEGLERVVGLDMREPARRMRHFEFHRVDIASSDLTGILEGVDTIVSLAGVSEDSGETALLAHVNVEGTRRLLAAAATVGVRRFVSTSSAAVYGAWPNNPVPITEGAALRPNPGYLPVLHDAEKERRIAEWCNQHPATTVTTLRLAPVVGPAAHGVLARAALGRPPVSVRGMAARPIQVVHVDDAVSALALVIARDLDGAYNVSADGWISDAVLRSLVGSGAPALPEEVARRMLQALWASGLGDAPPEVLPYLVHPWVVANDRLRAAGWTPAHSNESAILDSPRLAAEQTRRRTAFSVAAAAGTVGAGLGIVRLARVLRVRRARP